MATDLSITSTTSKLVTTIPKLQQGGTNWVAYKDRMEQYLLGQPGYRKHLMGRAKEPTAPMLAKDADESAKKAYEKKYDAYEDEMDEYLQKQSAIISTLTSTWPDDVHQLFMGVRPASALWAALCSRYENTSILTKTDLLVELSEVRCTGEDDENVLDVIATLIKKRNQYITAGGRDGV